MATVRYGDHRVPLAFDLEGGEQRFDDFAFAVVDSAVRPRDGDQRLEHGFLVVLHVDRGAYQARPRSVEPRAGEPRRGVPIVLRV